MSAEWSAKWKAARRNMPRVHPNGKGSPWVLRSLLGYKTKKDNGKQASCAMHCLTAENRGDRPRDAKRRQLLEALAGPYGTTVVRIIAIQRGLNLSRFKYWPDGKGGFSVSTERSK